MPLLGSLGVLLVGWFWLLTAQAQEVTAAESSIAPVAGTATAVVTEPAAGKQRTDRKVPLEWEVGAYGEIHFAFHGFGADQNRAGGAQRDRRAEFDSTRFALKLEGHMPYDIEFESEVEFEHGGVGAAIELEYEEFGEYEQEIEKGGEVLLEEFYLKKTFADRFSIKAGRFYVAVGLLSEAYRPTDYLASRRSEAETTILPAVWDEMGLALKATWPHLHLQLQAVNGLDSTGFSSQYWVASGHQSRFELVRATDMAGVLRLDAPLGQSLVGVSGYYGGTSRNRSKADMVQACQSANTSTVAPCGYVQASLAVMDLHGQLRVGPVRGSAVVVWGHLQAADKVSARNERLSNALDVQRTPVADTALATWAELGLDVAPWLGLGPDHTVEPFVRFDYYNTMFGTRSQLFANPRFERQVVTAGMGYTVVDAVVVKADVVHRWFGSDKLRSETTVQLAPGFAF